MNKEKTNIIHNMKTFQGIKPLKRKKTRLKTQIIKSESVKMYRFLENDGSSYILEVSGIDFINLAVGMSQYYH